jgi:hypothetical protein
MDECKWNMDDQWIIHVCCYLINIDLFISINGQYQMKYHRQELTILTCSLGSWWGCQKKVNIALHKPSNNFHDIFTINFVHISYMCF